MSKLFKVTIIPSGYNYSKSNVSPIYCIADNKEDCVKKVNRNMNEGYSIGKVLYLADEVSGVLFRKQKTT